MIVENAGFKGFSAHVTETVRVAHEGEVNKARYMPQDPMIIATKAVNGNVNVFDIRKHPSVPRDTVCRPNYILQGHTQEGYGLSWSPLQKGLIASGSDDRKVCLWDLASPRDSTVFSPIREFAEQRDVVEDVAWHPLDPNLLAACGDDSRVFFYDVRKSRSLQSVLAGIMNSRTYFGFTSGGHTGEDVFLAAYHPQGDIPMGLNTNVEINHYLSDVMGLERPLSELTNRIFARHTDVFAGMKADVQTNEKDGTLELRVKRGRHTLRVPAFSSVAYLDGKAVDLGSVAVYVDKTGLFYLPAFLSEVLK